MALTRDFKETVLARVQADPKFHVAQPYGDGLDLSASDAEIEATTRAKIESLPEFQPFDTWRQAAAARFGQSPS